MLFPLSQIENGRSESGKGAEVVVGSNKIEDDGILMFIRFLHSLKWLDPELYVQT